MAKQVIEQIVLPSVRDLGDGFEVRRALPSPNRRMVGPFIFFDGFGPTLFKAGTGLDVRPHPHIGLSTLTYLFDGEILHRDSIGTVQRIRPGEVNWMKAGAGVVHSERTPPDTRVHVNRVAGIQSWVALPVLQEESAPAFSHSARDALPAASESGVDVSILAGVWNGMSSPIRGHSDLFYASVTLDAGARFQMTAEHIERAFYLVDGGVEVVGEEAAAFDPGQLVALKPGAEVVLRAKERAHVIFLGGEPLPEKRHIAWNFVSSSLGRIEQAKEDWVKRRFPSVPDEHEYIPLPENQRPVHYP